MMVQCCDAIYGPEGNCSYEDVCTGFTTTPEPTVSPSVSPTICEDRKFCSDGEICTNANLRSLERATEQPPLGGLCYDTVEACCEEEFGMADCNYQDICAPTSVPTLEPTPNPSPGPTPSPTENPTKKPVEEEVSVPPTLSPPTLTPSTYAPTSCDDRRWYTLNTKTNFKQCTNGYDVPPVIGPPIVDIVTYYESRQECCVTEFADGECVYDDVCSPTAAPSIPPTTSEPTPFPSTELIVITGSPTFGSTPTVSKETTGPPTMEPDREKRWGDDAWGGDSWSSDSWGGDAGKEPETDTSEDRCTQFERETCCNQPSDKSDSEKTAVCNMLGCNLKKCGKWEDNMVSHVIAPRNSAVEGGGNGNNPDPLSNFWSGDDWGGDAWSDPNLDRSEDQCQQIERDTCCSQPSHRSDGEKRAVCDMLGCNFRKCGRRNDR